MPLRAYWVRHKKGVTKESFRAAGGKLARRSQFSVAALPIIRPGLTDAGPVGLVAWNRTGTDLPKGRAGDGKPTGTVKMKVLYNSKSGGFTWTIAATCGRFATSERWGFVAT
jgi:hypothetical protein